jgi:uncharacterized RDD family membrane protein YckC
MNQPSGQQPSPPPPSGGMPSWTNNITTRGTIAGPGGVALADTMDRIIAYIIDSVILLVVGFVIGTIMLSILGDNYVFFRAHNIVSALATAALTVVVSGLYFVGMWTRMQGATVGMRAMKLTVRDASSGAMVNQSQAITRWLYLAAPAALASIYVWGIIGWLISLAVLGYEIYLLYTTANSATRQGFHDVQAKTVVAKG